MKKFLSAKKKAKILAAVIGSATIFTTNTAAAMDEYNIDWNGKNIFRVQYYGEDDAETAADFFSSVGATENPLSWTMEEYLRKGTNKAFKLWAEIIGPGANISQPAQYFVGTYEAQNAAADAYSFKNGKNYQNPNLFYEIFQNAQEVEQFTDLSQVPNVDDESALSNYENIAFGVAVIGQNIGADLLGIGSYGWTASIDTDAIVPYIDLININTTMFHEIGHSLGVIAPIEIDKVKVGAEESPLSLYYYKGESIPEKSFMAHLYNQDGEKAPLEKGLISPSETWLDLAKQYYSEQGKDFDFNVFTVKNVWNPTERQAKTNLYFVGDNVTEVLDGKTFTRSDGEKYSGIPINAWENGTDFSHIELARSMMSHQNFVRTLILWKLNWQPCKILDTILTEKIFTGVQFITTA